MPQDASPIGVVAAANGEVFAKSSSGVRQLEPGSSVFQGEELVTGPDSNVEIRFIDDTLLSQGGGSTISLDDYAFDPSGPEDSELLFNMAQGTFRMVTGQIAEQNPERFIIGSPLATIGIRGTTTIHDISPGGEEKHGVEEIHSGKALLVQSVDGSVRMISSPRALVDIARSGMMGSVRAMTVQEFNSFREIAPSAIQQEQEIREEREQEKQQGQDDDQVDEQGDGQEGETDEGLAGGEDPGGGDVGPVDGGIVEGGVGALMDGGAGEGVIEDLAQRIFEELAEGDIEEVGKLLDELEKEVGDEKDQSDDGDKKDDGNEDKDDTDIDELLGGGGPLPAESTDDTSSSGSGTDDTSSGSSGSDDTSSSGDGVTTIEGGSGADDLEGTSGSDVLLGYGAGDTLDGKEGADTLDGGSGPDTLMGGLGSDSVVGGEDSDLIYGDTADERESGASDNDTLAGEGGDDVIYGHGGNDTLYGGDDSDTLVGGDGNDYSNGGEGDDTLYGDDGNDTIVGGTGADWIDYRYLDGSSNDGFYINISTSSGTATHSTGNDEISGVEGVLGSEFGDTITVSSDNSSITILGADGDDTLTGSDSSDFGDYISGGLGTDKISGQSGNDTLLGGQCDDSISGGAGSDIIKGESGDDTLSGGDGADYIYGGSEIDFVSYAEYSSTVVVDFENSTASAGGATDTLSGIEGVIGGSGDDSLIGHDSVDNIFRPGAGNDSISGGSTVDELDYSQREVGVSVDMNSGSAALYEGAEVDSFEGIENIMGTDHNDTIVGDSENNYLIGGDGNDTIDGDDGDDYIQGGEGSNSLSGGDGYDYDYLDYSWLFGDADGVELSNAHSGGTAEHSFGTDDIYGFEGIIGSDCGDTISGESNGSFVPTILGGDGDDHLEADMDTSSHLLGEYDNDNLRGWSGDDILDGGHCDDTLTGGEGHDTLIGGDGADVFYYHEITDSMDGMIDKVTDFDSGEGDVFKFNLERGFSGDVDGNVQFDSVSGGYGDTLDGKSGAYFVWDSTNSLLIYDPDVQDSGGEVVIANVLGDAVGEDDIELILGESGGGSP